MKFFSRVNKSTGVSEAIAQATVVLSKIESDSKTNSNGKPYGYFNADNAGQMVTGIAYDKTAKSYNEVGLAAGEEVIVECLATDLAQGINKNWQLALPVASDVSSDDIDAATAFLASLK